MMKRQREQGVALLLALGVLSLLLVSGMAFVTNALLAQKSAAAYRFRSQSQLLGKSAVNRVMMLMRYYLDAGDVQGIGELHSIFNGEINGQGDNDINVHSSSNDQINFSSDSLLTAVVDNAVRTAPTTPRWEYMWDNYDSNGRRTDDAKLVGRFAYWVLPGGSVNFSEVLRGNSDLLTNSMSRWGVRRGFGIRELDISGSYIDVNHLNELSRAFTGESYNTDPRQQDSPRANDYTNYVSMFNRVPQLTLTERNVIRRFLPPSGTEEEVYFYMPGYDRETFNPHRASGLTKYHRFDLTRTDWDALGGSPAANSDALVARLLGSPTERTGDETVDDTTVRTSDAIPALRRIHTAADHYNTPDVRRKQVAANLIDYCDSDSVATSDSTDWEATAPNYTGNDKTPYINEIMISPSVGITREESSETNDGNTTYTYTYRASIDMRMIAVELINLYEASFPDSDISIKGECTLEIAADDQPAQNTTVTFDIPLAGSTSGYTAQNGNYAYKLLYTESGAAGTVTADPVWSEITTAASATQLTDPVRLKVRVTNLKVTKVHLKTADGSADYVRDLETEITMTATELQGTVSGTTSSAEAYPHVGFEVDDPRENLYQGSPTDESLMNWRKIESAASATDSEGAAMNANTSPEKIAGFTFNTRNAFCTPANSDATADKDLESATEPENISSAYIANAPMKTLVELGAIHRAAKWQTINLRASRCTPETAVDNDITSTEGDTYQQGDAWILDQVKLTPRVQVPHRLYINNPPGRGTPESRLLYAALFRGLHWEWGKHYDYENPVHASGIGGSMANVLGDILAGPDTSGNHFRYNVFSRAEVINFSSEGHTLWNGYGRVSPETDASSETIPTLVSSLISFFPRSPDPVTMILAAQSIRDVGTPAGFSMSKLRNDGSGNSDTATVYSGRFDYNGATYFDEITGTSRYYVEIGTNPDTRKVDLLRFEPLD